MVGRHYRAFAMTEEHIHTCSYFCHRPDCIKAQRDELRDTYVMPNLKDHEVARMVNALRDVAKEYGQTQQLRERIAGVVRDYLGRGS